MGGCASSTQVVTDQVTGKQTTKHKLGGAYPGNRRKPQQAYQPGASQFNEQGQATAHFVAYGGGNALVLKPQHGVAQPVVNNAKRPQYIQVTLPDGVYGGQQIHVQAPDGRLNEIIVPDGFGPGSTFTVEFAEAKPTYEAAMGTAPTTQHHNNAPYVSTPSIASATPAPPPAANPNFDDGFATGFNNPSFVPSAPAAGGGDYSSYPSASDAKPVYNATTY